MTKESKVAEEIRGQAHMQSKLAKMKSGTKQYLTKVCESGL